MERNINEKWRKRAFAGLLTGFICLATVSLCLTSCRITDDESSFDDVVQENPSVKDDAFESKVVYYEAQIQNLTAQLSTMEQQMYIMREDYLTQLEQLEQRFNEKQLSSNASSPSAEAEQGQSGHTQIKQPTGSIPEQDEDVKLFEYTYRLENNFAILTSYLGNDKDVVVPAAVDGYLVIGLADRTFADSDIRSVTLPDTVEKLGWFTFYQCENLEKVVLPAGLSVIGYASFDGCAPSLCLYVKPGSYAEQFANSFGLRYEEQT